MNKKFGHTCEVTFENGYAIKEVKLDDPHNVECCFCELYFMKLLGGEYFIKLEKVELKDDIMKIYTKQYRPLDDILKNGERIDKGKVIEGLIRGLCKLHYNGIYCCDMKSENVVLDNFDNPIYIDLATYGTNKNYIKMDSEIYRHKKTNQNNEFNDVWQLGIIILDIITGGKVERHFDNMKEGETYYSFVLNEVEKLKDNPYQKMLKMMLNEENKTSMVDIATSHYGKIIVRRVKYLPKIDKVKEEIKEERLCKNAEIMATHLAQKYDLQLSMFLATVIHERDICHEFYNASEMKNKNQYIMKML